MKQYSAAAVERMMKIQEVILRAMAKKVSWWQAAEIMGISARQMRRWKVRYEQEGYDGLWDRRRQSPSPRRVAVEVDGCASAYRHQPSTAPTTHLLAGRCSGNLVVSDESESAQTLSSRTESLHQSRCSGNFNPKNKPITSLSIFVPPELGNLDWAEMAVAAPVSQSAWPLLPIMSPELPSHLFQTMTVPGGQKQPPWFNLAST